MYSLFPTFLKESLRHIRNKKYISVLQCLQKELTVVVLELNSRANPPTDNNYKKEMYKRIKESNSFRDIRMYPKVDKT